MFVKQVLKIVTFWVIHISRKKFLLFQNSNFDLSEISLSQLTKSNCFFYFSMFSEKEISIQKLGSNF